MGIVKEDGEIEVTFQDRRERPSNERAEELFSQGSTWLDIIDIRNKARICPHWRPCLAGALIEIEEAKAADKEIDLPFDWQTSPASDFIYDTINNTDPSIRLQTRELPGLHQASVFGTQTCTDPADKYQDYKPCIMCEFFSHDANPEGSPKPFIGTCNVDNPDKGLLSLVDTDQFQTKTYLSCNKFFPRRDYLS